MSLAAGTRLGPYEIVALVGAGGMGEVYRARDTRLERTVAIKILPGQTADLPDVRQRFEREARTISALHHPHICTLFDIGCQDGIDYLVMEYLEGETLADRLKKGPLAIEQTLRIALQAADALDRAHRTGIIHRDLKPGNIMLTRDGAKVMDFGLAKFHEKNAGAMVSGGSVMQTLTSPLTGEGAIVGTLQYMAPEQLEGQEADTRSDIFAFGAVLYEMASGRRPFAAKTHAGLIAQIMSNEPASLSSVAPLIPATLERLVRTCLAKDPAERWENMHDVLLNLRGIAEGGSQTDAAAPAIAHHAPASRLWLAAAGAVLLAGIGFAAGWFLRSAPETPVTRLHISAPEKTTFGYGVAISPDGKRLVFAAKSSTGLEALWLRPLDSLAAHVIPGTEGASFPFWSPDSRSVAFFADGKLKRVDMAGGTPQTICEAPDGRGGSWSRDGMILFTPESAGPVYSVPAAGGTAVRVTKIDSTRTDVSHRWPYFLPDGRHFLCFIACVRETSNAIAVGSVGEQGLRILTSANSSPIYATGYLLYVKGQALIAQRFDPKALRFSGEPYPIAQDVSVTGQTAPTAYGAFSASQNGILTYRAGGAELGQFTWFDRSGKQLGTAGPPGEYAEPALSQDEKRLAFVRSEGPDKSSLWLLDLSKNVASKFTFGRGTVYSPTWSPDGAMIIFGSSTDRNIQLFQKLSTGAANEELLLNTPLDKFPDHWSPNPRTLVFETFDPNTKADLWILPMDGDRKPVPYRQSPFNETHARVSPDGHWLAYTADDTGRAEVYVESFPVPGKGKYQISLDGGDEAMWRRDGKELFYRSLDRKVVAVPVSSGLALQAGSPQTLFEARAPAPAITNSRNYYVVSGDGQKFLMFTPITGGPTSPIVTVLNWTSGLSH